MNEGFFWPSLKLKLENQGFRFYSNNKKYVSLVMLVVLWSALIARVKEATDRFLLCPKTSRKLAITKVLGVGSLSGTIADSMCCQGLKKGLNKHCIATKSSESLL